MSPKRKKNCESAPNSIFFSQDPIVGKSMKNICPNSWNFTIVERRRWKNHFGGMAQFISPLPTDRWKDSTIKNFPTPVIFRVSGKESGNTICRSIWFFRNERFFEPNKCLRVFGLRLLPSTFISQVQKCNRNDQITVCLMGLLFFALARRFELDLSSLPVWSIESTEW